MDTRNNICEAAECCRMLFDTLISSLPQKHEERIVFLRSTRTDFNLWCSAIRATSKGRDSLDYRLRNHEDVRKAICNLLSGLKASLAKYEWSVLRKDSLEDQTAAPDSPSSTGSYVSWDAISDEESSEDGLTNGPNAVPDRNPFVAESILFITTTMEHLAWFSIAIRKAGDKFRFARIDKELDKDSTILAQFREHLIPIILKGYPDADSKAPLNDRIVRVLDSKRLTAVQQRLIDANILRKHRIEYITKARGCGEYPEQRPTTEEAGLRVDLREHADAGGPPMSVAGRTIPQSAHSSSIPRPRQQGAYPTPRTATDLDSRVDFGRFQPSQVMSTRTNLTRVARTQAYPRSPESALCPYCADVLVLPPKEKRAEREKCWKAHVCQDILPYTCFIQGCTNNPETPKMFLTSEELLTHMIENHSSIVWVCDFCTSNDDTAEHSTVNLTFQSAKAWGDHIDEEHPDLVETHDRQVLAQLNQQTMIGPLSCPLCDEIKTPTMEFRINDHILGHLHEFALWALPAICENGSNDLGSDLQSRGTVSATTETDSPEDESVLAGLDYPTFVPGDITAVLDKQLQHLSGMQILQDFETWVQRVHWTSRTRADQEFWWAHLSKLQHVISVYQEQNQEAKPDVDGSMLENLRNILDELIDYEQQRDPNWSSDRTDPSAPEIQSSRINLGGSIWPVNPSQARPWLASRDKILDDLESELFEQRHSLQLGEKFQPQGQLRIALEGGPGVGKTVLATKLAHRLQAGNGYDYAIFWVDASSASSLEEAYQEIWVAIGEPQSPLIDPMHCLVYYLNWELSCPWVMILDGIEDQTLLQMVLRGFIPSGLNGSLLFTTRDASWLSILGPSPFTMKIEVPEDDLSLDELRREQDVQGEPGMFHPSSKSNAIPTYHVVPRFDLAAKGGPLALGTIVDSLRMLRPLNRRAIVPIPPSLRYEPVKHHGVTERFSHLRQGHGSVWARVFARQVLGGGAEATEEDEMQSTVKCDELVTLYFDPDDRYVARSLAVRGVTDYFIGSGYEDDVYMITGLKIARNLRLDSTISQKRQINLDVTAQEPNLGSALEAQASFEARDQHTIEFEAHDIVVGFRVRRYAYGPASWNFLSKKKKLEGDDYLVHAAMYEHQKEEMTTEGVGYHEVPIEEEQRAQEEAMLRDEQLECWIV